MRAAANIMGGFFSDAFPARFSSADARSAAPRTTAIATETLSTVKLLLSWVKLDGAFALVLYHGRHERWRYDTCQESIRPWMMSVVNLNR